jgi:hypothetical protein
MKKFYVIGLAIFIAACSDHAVRCDGSLQPINVTNPEHAAPAKGTVGPGGTRP